MIDLPPFRSRVTRALALGLPGVAILPLTVEPPPGVPALALTVNPAVLLLLAALAGGWAAPRIGATSAVILGGAIRRRSVMGAVAFGLALGIVTAPLDALLAPIWRGEATHPATLVEAAGGMQTLFGVLYGGFTEEVLMRWGLLTILAVALLRLAPRRVALAIATCLAAALFALAHLPALAVAGVELTPGLLSRTLGFNFVLGLVFGWVFLRHGLEATIATHAGFHVSVAALAAAVA
jgi:hypothetical protein